MGRATILAVEDDEDILELLSFNLEREGHEVLRAESAEEAMAKLKTAQPGLILLDLMLPDMDGLEFCKRLRGDTQYAAIPIIMVTAKGEEADVVTGLELGADDYMTKPFKPRELVARVKAVLRRTRRPTAKANEETIDRGGILLDPGRREVTVDDLKIDLTYTEFQVLQFLMQRPGWVFTRYQIVDAVRGDNYPVTDRSVDVQIVGLRKKLGPASDNIETVRGIGYRYRDGDC